jgi:hypothetical protein
MKTNPIFRLFLGNNLIFILIISNFLILKFLTYCIYYKNNCNNKMYFNASISGGPNKQLKRQHTRNFFFS